VGRRVNPLDVEQIAKEIFEDEASRESGTHDTESLIGCLKKGRSENI
jgi:hypothetical protein